MQTASASRKRRYSTRCHAANSTRCHAHNKNYQRDYGQELIPAPSFCVWKILCTFITQKKRNRNRTQHHSISACVGTRPVRNGWQPLASMTGRKFLAISMTNWKRRGATTLRRRNLAGMYSTLCPPEG